MLARPAEPKTTQQLQIEQETKAKRVSGEAKYFAGRLAHGLVA